MPKVLVLMDVPDVPGVDADELRAVVTKRLDDSFWLPGRSGSVDNLPNWVTVSVTNDVAAAMVLGAAKVTVDARDPKFCYSPAAFDDAAQVLEPFADDMRPFA